MARDQAFIEVQVRRGLFSRWGAAARRFDLPLSWTANRRRLRLFFGPALFSALATMCLFLAFVGAPWFGVSSAVFFACPVYILVRKNLGLSRLGPGRVTIDRDGFTDHRLGVGHVPWRCVRHGFTHQARRPSRVDGVMLLLDGDRFTKALSRDYRSAYLFPLPKRWPRLFIDLGGHPDGSGLAEAIHALIDAGKFDLRPPPSQPVDGAGDA